MSLTIDIPIWQGLPIGTAAGSTPMGYYDTDAQFLSDAPKVSDFCARRLGYPIMDVELQSGSFFAAFEEAITEFSNIVNEYNIVDNFLQLQGSPTGSTSNLSQTLIAPNVARTIQISKEYGSEAGVGGRITFRTGSISVYRGQQNYNLNSLVGDALHSGSRVEIKRIYHEGPPAIVRYFDPFVGTGMGSQQMLQTFGWGSYSPGVSFLMQPMYADLLRLQAIEFNDTIRRSNYGFELVNNQLKLFPIPTGNYTLWFQYILESDRSSLDNISTGGVISDMSSIPYNRIPYGQINHVGKQWILKYMLAICKEILGNIRGKYQQISYAGNSDVTLNASDLLTQASSEKETLVTQLREMQDKMSRKAQLEKQQAESTAVQDTLNKIPLKIYVF